MRCASSVLALLCSLTLVACKSDSQTVAPAPGPPERTEQRSEPAERWAGTIVLPQGQRLDLMVALTPGDPPTATMTIPAQKLLAAPLRDVATGPRTRRFTLGPPNPEPNWAHFELTVSEDGALADGLMKQGGGTFRVILQQIQADAPDRSGFRGDLPPLPGEPWSGTIAISPGQSLAFTVRLEVKDGAPTGTIDIPAQGLLAGALHDVSLTDATMGFTYRPPGVARSQWAVFDLQRAGTSATGTMKQAGQTLVVTAKRGADTTAHRPQNPEPPLPYTSREVRVDTSADVSLAGTLTLPAGSGPHPAALLLSGSGPQDRDETLYDHKPFLVLADHLTRRGIAVLRLDDRGVGGSTGDTQRATSADFATDARAAVAFLARQPEIQAGRIGLIGHSEGGLLATMLAGSEGSGGVAFIVLLASPGVSGREIILAQTSTMVAGKNTPPADVAAARAAAERALDLLGARASRDEGRAAVRAMVEAQRAIGAPIAADGVDAAVEAALTQMGSPWYRYFVAYDPAPDLRRVKVPVLAISGGLDRQVPPEVNLAAIRAALEAAGNTDTTIVELPGLNHLMQSATTGGIHEYAQIEETFAPAALEQISTWIEARTDL